MADEVASDRSFARRVSIAVGIVLLAVIFMYLLRYVGQVLLLGFAGILLAVALNSLATLLQRYAPVNYPSALLLVLVILAVSIGAAGALLGPHIVDQMTQLGQRLPESMDTLRSRLEGYQWGQALLQNIPQPREILASATDMMGQIAGAFSTLLGALANALVILVIGIYMAIHPQLYTGSAVHLLPPDRRDRAHDVLQALARALRRWLVGRVTTMALLGILVYLGLSLIGVPLALALGFLAGLFSFVPYLGPLLALVPILLVALFESPVLALYVLPLYGVIQLVESYLITPLISERAISIPPAFLIIVQVLGGVLAGVLGVLLAEPLAVMVAILVQMLYIEDTLGDSVQLLGERPPDPSNVEQPESAP